MNFERSLAIAAVALLALGAIVGGAAPSVAATADSIMANAKASRDCRPGQSRFVTVLYRNPNAFGDCASGYRKMGGGGGTRCARRVFRCTAAPRVN